MIRFKKRNESFSLFEGSDFNLDQSLEDAVKKIDTIDFIKLTEVASFKPLIAKRHYHQTGALRWMDIVLSPFESLERLINKPRYTQNIFGSFILIIPTSFDEYLSAKKK